MHVLDQVQPELPKYGILLHILTMTKQRAIYCTVSGNSSGAGAPGKSTPAAFPEMIDAGVAALQEVSSDDYRLIADEDVVLKIWSAMHSVVDRPRQRRPRTSG